LTTATFGQCRALWATLTPSTCPFASLSATPVNGNWPVQTAGFAAFVGPSSAGVCRSVSSSPSCPLQLTALQLEPELWSLAADFRHARAERIQAGCPIEHDHPANEALTDTWLELLTAMDEQKRKAEQPSSQNDGPSPPPSNDWYALGHPRDRLNGRAQRASSGNVGQTRPPPNDWYALGHPRDRLNGRAEQPSSWNEDQSRPSNDWYALGHPRDRPNGRTQRESNGEHDVYRG
jgi:hypothetical protein